MKLLLTILACLVAASAGAQTIKSLGYNTTNGQVVYSGTNDLRFPATIRIGTNQSGFSSGGQFLTLTDAAGGVAMIIGTNAITSYDPIAFSSTGNAASTRTNLGGTTVGNALFTAATTNAARVALGATVVGENIFTVPLQYQELFLRINADNTVSSLSPAATRTNLGLGATNNVTFSNITASGTLAVTGNVTMSGVNNTMPNATNAASGSSLMTRNLFDERLPITFGLMDEPQADFGTVTLANGASGSKAAGGFEVTTGASNNATVVWNASSQAAFGRKHTEGISGTSTVWSGRVMVGWWFTRSLSTNSEMRLQYGRAFNATTHAALSARGVGVRIATNSVFFETHDGTTGFETTNAVTATNPMLYSAIVEAGVAKFYAGQTLVATVTNNVPTNNSSGNDFGWVMSISNTSTNSSIMRVFANPGFVMQQ